MEEIKKKILCGYMACNKGVYDLENMSFFNSKKKAINFHKGQEVRPIKIIFYIDKL